MTTRLVLALIVSRLLQLSTAAHDGCTTATCAERCVPMKKMCELIRGYRLHQLNPLEYSGNSIVPHRIMKLVHWPLMSRLLHLVQRRGDWAGPQPAQAKLLLAVSNVTANPSTATVPITVLLYNGPLLSGFNVPING